MVLTGQLRVVALPALLQLVDSESITGALALEGSLTSGAAPSAASVVFHDGRPVRAAIGPLTGRTALLEAFLLPHGRFELRLDDDTTGNPIGDCMELVMAGCRLSDEWHRLGPLHLDVATPPAAAALAPLLPHLAAGTVATAVARAGVARVAVVDPLLAALDAGQLRAVRRAAAPATPATPAAPPPVVTAPSGDWRDLVDAARTHTRARAFEQAEALLQHAQRLAPDERVVLQNLARVRLLRAAG